MKYGFFVILLVALCSCKKSEDTKMESPHLTTTSTFRSWIENVNDDFEYATAHIVNRRFTFVPDGPVKKGTAKHLVLLETFDLEDSMAHEVANGNVSVEAYLSGLKTEKKPIWAMKAIGRSGEVFRELYKIHQAGCCGNTDRDLYFSIKNGKELFTSTEPILLVNHVELRQWRFIGYDGGTGEHVPPEMKTGKNIVGILTYGNGEVPSKRLALMSNSREDYICKSLGVRTADKNIQTRGGETTIYSTSKEAGFGGVSVEIVLEPSGDGPTQHLIIPIESDNIAVKSVQGSSSLQVKLLN